MRKFRFEHVQKLPEGARSILYPFPGVYPTRFAWRVRGERNAVYIGEPSAGMRARFIYAISRPVTVVEYYEFDRRQMLSLRVQTPGGNPLRPQDVRTDIILRNWGAYHPMENGAVASPLRAGHLYTIQGPLNRGGVVSFYCPEVLEFSPRIVEDWNALYGNHVRA